MVRFDPAPPQVKRYILLATVLSCLAILSSSPTAGHRFLIINLTASVPLGLYVRSGGLPKTGQMVLIRLPTSLRNFAAQRGYLPFARLLIKSVTAGPADVVCRLGSRLWIGGYNGVWPSRTDGLGRPLPKWSGCRRLGASELFVLGTQSGSFDGRYFGPINRQSVVAVVRPILVFGP